MLVLAMTGAVALIGDLLFTGIRVWIYTGALALAIAALWFVRPLLRRSSSGP
jgi:hypothetical protein